MTRSRDYVVWGREVAEEGLQPVEMICKSHFQLLVLLVLTVADAGFSQSAPEFSRDDFPSTFVFGAGTSAYQVEGAAAEDGRSPSIWDTFTHAGKMIDKSTGDVTSDEYHKYKEDVGLMSDTGLEAYKFSISWSRLLPDGRGAINPKGLSYYNNLINELVERGIQPHVTLHHQDLPQVLEDEYLGWLSPNIVNDFTQYAEVCFREYGDRVSYWTTITQPNIIAQAAYDTGIYPPSRCSYPFGTNCTGGDSTVEPYVVAHHMLLAHAATVSLYRTKYQAVQNGWIGLNIYTFWCYPLTNSSADIEATQRVRDFNFGWMLNPVVFGDYPEIMKMNAGSRLPSFTRSQSEEIKGSFDFIGINHYISAYVTDNSQAPTLGPRDTIADTFALIAADKNSTPTSKFIPTKIPVDPIGLQKMLEYIKQVYGNPPIYIHENGYGLGTNNRLNDTGWIDSLTGFIGSTLNAIRNASNVRGYFVWSFLDQFEFLAGYTSGFGIYFVDFKDKERRRTPKLSAYWYSNFLKRKSKMSIQSSGLNATSHEPL